MRCRTCLVSPGEGSASRRLLKPRQHRTSRTVSGPRRAYAVLGPAQQVAARRQQMPGIESAGQAKTVVRAPVRFRPLLRAPGHAWLGGASVRQ
eukprot:14801803-Alexandrium_andersonii.AAC.1